MAIQVGTQITQQLDDQGAITTLTSMGGDLSGTMPNATVTKVQGVSIPSTGYAVGLGWRYDGTQMALTTLLNEDSTFSGDVSGDQVSGITVTGIRGIGVEITSMTSGQILKYNGTSIVNEDSSEGFSVSTTSTAVSAVNKQKIFTNTTSAAVTITCPSSPSEGDNFIVYDSHGNAGTNNITIAVPSGDSIEGTTDETLTIDINNAIVEMYYNGTTWKYYVPYTRP